MARRVGSHIPTGRAASTQSELTLQQACCNPSWFSHTLVESTWRTVT